MLYDNVVDPTSLVAVHVNVPLLSTFALSNLILPTPSFSYKSMANNYNEQLSRMKQTFASMLLKLSDVLVNSHVVTAGLAMDTVQLRVSVFPWYNCCSTVTLLPSTKYGATER